MVVALLHLSISLILFITFIDKPKPELLEEAKYKRQAILLNQAQLIKNTLGPVKNTVDELKGIAQKSSVSLPELKNYLPKQFQGDEIWFVADLEGNVYSSNLEWVSSYSKRFYVTGNPFQSVLSKAETSNSGEWTNVFLDTHLEEYVIGYGSLIYQDNKVIGIVGGIIAVDGLIQDVIAKNTIGNINTFIHGQDGEVIYHPDYGLKLLRQTDYYSSGRNAQLILRPSLANYIDKSIEGEQVPSFKERSKMVLADSTKVEGTEWYVVVYQPEKDIFQPREMVVFSYSLGALGSLIILIVVIYWLSRFMVSRRVSTITTPLNRWINSDATENNKENLRYLIKDDEFADLGFELRKFINLEQRNRQRLVEENDTLLLKVEENKALAQAINFSDNIVFILSPELSILQADTKSERLLAQKKSELVGQGFLDFVHPHMEFVKEQILNQIRRKDSWVGELILKQVDSVDEIWVNCSITPMRSKSSSIEKFVMTVQDISSVKDSQSKIEQLAYVDDLTGLSNRAFFLAQLDKLVEISKRGRYDFALFYFDIDDFKKVNDFLGHDGGDLLLKIFSREIGKFLRTEDVFARVGGDEFALITGGVKSQEDVIYKINQIFDVAREPFELFGHKVQVGVSIGVTMSSSDATDAELLLQHADMAMYEAKSQGKNTYHFYSQELNRLAKERIEIEQDLIFALENDELDLHFQPKVDSRGPKLVGYEALIRWTSKKRGFVSPAEFIPIAEQSNLILKVGDWVINRAAKFIKQQEQSVVVSINLSAKQFESGNLCSDLRKVISQHNIDPQFLEVEITESSLMIDIEGAIKQLHEIQKLGISISVDDFGTGYSSLSYLKRLPVRTLKIDRSFIKDIPEDKNDMEITSAIIAMAKQLGLNVIAEGAETPEQVDFLKSQECFYIQGYVYSKPLPFEEAIKWTPPFKGGIIS